MTPLGNKYHIANDTESFDRVPSNFDRRVDWFFSEEVEDWYKGKRVTENRKNPDRGKRYKK